MDSNIKPESYRTRNISDRRLAEISYIRKLNTRMVFFALPFYIFFTVFFYFLGNTIQTFIFLLLTINAVIAQILGSILLKDLKSLTISRQIALTIAFGLLAISLITGLLSDDVFISYPWIYFYPIIAIIFFGGRPGLICALLFSIITVVVIYLLDLPELNAWNIKMFKLNSAVSLLSLLGLGFISEKTRVNMRNDLLDARNRYKAAERKQRETNVDLKKEIELRAQSEKALAQSEIHYRTLFEESTASLWEEDWSKVKAYLKRLPDDALNDLEDYFEKNPHEKKACFYRVQVTSVNKATLDLYEAKSEEILIHNVQKILPVENIDWIAERIVAIYNQGHYDGEISVKTLSGRVLHLLVKSAIVSGHEKSWEKVYTSVYDITEKVTMDQEKKRVEKQLQHTRQIQSIASLASGISQQFDNSLSLIYGNLDLLKQNIHADENNAQFIGAIKEASDHIGEFTDQLLAYSEGFKYQPKEYSANDLIQELLHTSKITRESSTPISTKFTPDVYLAASDVTQIKMVVESVLANAVESMNGGGKITISTLTTTISHGQIETDIGLEPGRYAIISVEDQGIGMDEKTLQQMFEPFFTTKSVGRGLGMATAFGIVRNHDGIITVESEPNKGTTVMIYLPGTDAPAQAST